MTQKSAPQTRSLQLPVLFTAAVLLAYGIPVFLGWLSFYGDDWIYIFNYRMLGAGSFPAFVAWDRPYSAWIYQLTTALFGDVPLYYHLLILLQRWLAVFLFWQILKKVWQSADRMVAWAVLLFAVYPGFRQQPIAVQFILHFASLDLCLFSIWCMLKTAELSVLKAPRWQPILLTLLGFLASCVALFSCEYFFGLEAIRPFLLWFWALNVLPARQQKVRWGKLFAQWVPYFISLGLFLYWRVFVFAFQTYQPKLLDELQGSLPAALGTMAKRVFADLITVTLTIWRKVINPPNGRENQWIWGGLILGSFLVLWLTLRRSAMPATGEAKRTVIRKPETQFVITGLAAVLAAGIPFWATMIQLELTFPWDRPTISFSPGVALLMSAGISLIFARSFQPVIAALLVAFSIGTHFGNGMVYRDESRKMNDYFWQLAWRAPSLEPGTVLVSENIPLDRTSDSDLTPVVNWQFAPSLTGSSYRYKYFDLDLRYQSFYANALTETQPITHDYRSHQFASDTAHTLALFYKRNSCLWVIADAETAYPGLPENLRQAAAFTNPKLIQLDASPAAIPPAAIGAEPVHGFCYAFQQINRALQSGDADAAIQAAESAEAQALTPADPIDWIPFVKADVLAGELEQASVKIAAILQDSSRQPLLCNQLRDLVAAFEIKETQPILALGNCPAQ